MKTFYRDLWRSTDVLDERNTFYRKQITARSRVNKSIWGGFFLETWLFCGIYAAPHLVSVL